jgi:hypothetical protein
MTCDASLPVSSDAGGACTACEAKQCVPELAKCAADCECAPIEACLEVMSVNFAACPGAINAVMGGNQTLVKLTDCLGTNCLAPCFPGTTIGDQ